MRQCNGYWSNKLNLQHELEAFLAQRQKSDAAERADAGHNGNRARSNAALSQMEQPATRNKSCTPGDELRVPRMKDLKAAGRFDLTGAIQLWGGMHQVARELGWHAPKKRSEFALVHCALHHMLLNAYVDLITPMSYELTDDSTVPASICPRP